MLGKLAISFVAAVSLGVAALPAGAMAAGKGGHAGGVGHVGGSRSFSMNRGVAGHPFVGRGSSAIPFAGRHVSSDHRFAWIGHRRVFGRHIYGFIPGIGYGYYWYYDDCYALTDYGWINICVYNY